MLGGAPPSRFPADYVHVADVQANGLRQAVQITTDTGSIFDGSLIPWEKSEGVRSMGHINRDTDAGDVIVDPQGRAYRVGDGHFEEIADHRSKFDRELDAYAARGSDKPPDKRRDR
jgi:hypothetical protein